MRKYEDRILFLKEFTKHLVINSKKPGIEMQMIVREEPREQKIILTQELGEEKEFQKSIIESIKPKIATQPQIRALIKQITKPIAAIKPRGRMKTFFMPPTISPKQRYQLKPMVNQEYQPSVMSGIPTQIQPSPGFQPANFNLDKINFLVQDPRVSIIECPGPGKFILARTGGKVTVTKISLSQEEIHIILEKFSQASKIPIISGLFKAVVGNLLITAVISETIGSRFMITKITPSFILEQQRNLGY